MNNIRDSSIYENIVDSNNIDKELINKALEIVKNFIIKKKRILVGGMAIDYALRKKKDKLYDSEKLPDFDYLTPEFHKDSYEIAEILHSMKFPHVQVINAMHLSTMRVRTNFYVVSDATYCPKEIYDRLPVVKYKGFNIIHPYYQYLDQHIVLGYPFKNPPFENINGRWKKDMTRYELLHKQYPVAFGAKLFKNKKTTNIKFQLKDIKKQCVGGFPALFIWNNRASTLGFKLKPEYKSLGDIKITTNIDVNIPYDSNGFTIYSNNLWKFYKKYSSDIKINLSSSGLYRQSTKKDINEEDSRWYNSFMEKVPRKVIFGKWEVLDNMGSLIGASILNKNLGIYVANLQILALYFMSHFVLFKTINKDDRGYTFYLAYKNIQDLITWASRHYEKNNKMFEFLPTEKTYGTSNYSETYLESKRMINIKLGEKSKYYQQLRPDVVYMNKTNGKIEQKKYNFDPSKSELYKFNGEKTEPFYENPLILEEKLLEQNSKK